MSASLRERLRALVKPYEVRSYGAITGQSDYAKVAIAAARLTLEDAAGVCDDKAIVYDGLEDSASTRYFADKMRGSRDASGQCAAAIRARASELAP